MSHPNIVTVASVLRSEENITQLPSGKWVPARPVGYASLGRRLRAAWLVFTGRADALTWEGQP